ncbi:MAG: hypothetical protein ACOKSU_24880 [Pseudomonas sp.]|uniref:hypothetical protein n=1 Tax=Pseudomonas TaxID=286 RepID=UPI0003C08F9C|nr:hypothetical protein [Pseudomonas sp. VLB120]AGZ36544.1 hypothetical protein PVLB_18815 [Pseudomonas sp. VLB120]
MQSADYVPGESGWKITKELIEINGGLCGPVRIGDLEQSGASRPKVHSMVGRSSMRSEGKPFVVVDGVTYINQALVDDFSISSRITEETTARASADEASSGRIGALEAAMAEFKPSTVIFNDQSRFTLTLTKNAAGNYVTAGIGLGVDTSRGETKSGQTDVERAIKEGDVCEVLRLLTEQITDSEPSLGLHSQIPDPADAVRDVIRQELKPGGLLHRR